MESKATKVFYAPAKLNLFLHVTGHNDQNYHELESLIAFADLYDELHVTQTKEFNLTISGEFAPLIQNEPVETNLCYRTLQVFEQKTGISPKLHLELIKNIPIAAGMGGGSSDAATFLLALNQLYDTHLSFDELLEMAEVLGADVPVCLYQKTCLVHGIGEELSGFIDHPELYILLVNPRIGLSTQKVFQTFHSSGQPFSPSVLPEVKPQYNSLEDLQALFQNTQNDLLQSALEQAPQLQPLIENLTNLPHCLHANMTGSGATCFAVFSNDKHLKEAYSIFFGSNASFWLKTAKLI